MTTKIFSDCSGESEFRLRVDSLRFREEFDAIVEREDDPRRRDFYRFVGDRFLEAASVLEGDAAIDMRAVAEFADRMFSRESLLRKILAGEAGEDDW